MSTQAQIEANRRNAQHSTGPRTDEGKAVVARNAIKHGIFCQHLILPGESAEELEALRQGIYQRLRPADELEKLYVERIVVAAWKIRRLLANDCASYENPREWCPAMYDLESQQRLVTSLERAWDKAMSELMKLQKNRPDDTDDPMPVASEENKPNSSQPVAEAPVSSDASAEPRSDETNPIDGVEATKSMKTNPILVQNVSEVTENPQDFGSPPQSHHRAIT